ncbi:MAG: DNA-directed RNA polymerase subunit omega [Lachnospiraceae bacterium]|nr:DNA-directed RNA polymerase subunit omega [Lachnospiraceae bacterium]
MIHPSYKELIEVINEGQDIDEAPLVTSRYSIVLATSKRARQIIAGAEPTVRAGNKKPLSIAVEELYKGNVHMIPEEEEELEEELLKEDQAMETAEYTENVSDVTAETTAE